MEKQPTQVSRFLDMANGANHRETGNPIVTKANQETAQEEEKPKSSASLMADQINRKIQTGTQSDTSDTKKESVIMPDTSEATAPETDPTTMPAPASAPVPAEQTIKSNETKAAQAIDEMRPTNAEHEETLELEQEQIVSGPEVTSQSEKTAETSEEANDAARKSAFKPSAAVETALRDSKEETTNLSASALVNGEYLPRVSMSIAQGASFDDINAMIAQGHLRLGIEDGRPAVFVTKTQLRALAEEKEKEAALIQKKVEEIMGRMEEMKAEMSKSTGDLVRAEATQKLLTDLIDKA